MNTAINVLGWLSVILAVIAWPTVVVIAVYVIKPK